MTQLSDLALRRLTAVGGQALDDKSMKAKTEDACQKTRSGAESILKACKALADNTKNTEAKRTLLDGASPAPALQLSSCGCCWQVARRR